MKKSIRAFYITSSGVIESGEVDYVTHSIVRFKDGGWNPVEDCFLSRRQCEKFKVVPPPKVRRAIEAARVSLSQANRAITTALDQLSE